METKLSHQCARASVYVYR